MRAVVEVENDFILVAWSLLRFSTNHQPARQPVRDSVAKILIDL